jgi:flavorubredoxin
VTEPRVAEVANGVYQLRTYFPDMDFTVNQYLLTGEEPLLFHTGMRSLFRDVAAAVASVVAVDSLRWIAFGHVEADECGAMNEWLAAAPDATVTHGALGCTLSIGDMAVREPRPLEPGDVLDTGGHRVEWIDTPHVPHTWEAGLLYDHDTRTLLCGDLFSRYGDYAPTTADDVVGPAADAEDQMPSMSLHPASGRLIRSLSAFDVDALASMHGPVFTGDCHAALHDLASDADQRVDLARRG